MNVFHAVFLLAMLLGLSATTHTQEAPPFIIEARFEPSIAYVGQRIQLVIVGYSDTLRDARAELGVLADFWQSETRSFAGSVERDGKAYGTATFTTTLYPLRAGELVAPSARLIFEDTVFADAVTLPAAPAPLQVTTVPDPPTDFSGWVGRVESVLSADMATVGLGEPLEVSLRLSGDALFATSAAPVLSLSGYWRIFRGPTVSPPADPLTGFVVVTYQWTLVPDRAGRHTIAVPVVSAFDPLTETFYSIMPDPLQIDVLPAADGRLENDSPVTEDAASRLFAAPELASDPVSSPPAGLWLALGLTSLGVVSGVQLLRLSARRRRQNRRRRAIPRARATTLQAFSQPDDPTLKSRLEQILNRLVSDRWPTPTPPPTALRALIEDLRFAPDFSADRNLLRESVLAVLDSVETLPEGDL